SRPPASARSPAMYTSRDSPRIPPGLLPSTSNIPHASYPAHSTFAGNVSHVMRAFFKHLALVRHRQFIVHWHKWLPAARPVGVHSQATQPMRVFCNESRELRNPVRIVQL